MRSSLLLVLVLAACGGDDGGGTLPDAAPADAPPEAVPRQVVMESVPLAASEIVEAVLVGGPPDYARITATAGGATLDWNLHGHAGGGTQTVEEELAVPSVDYTFTPSARADWYLLLRNRGQAAITVDLRIELYGEMTWSGWQ